ncbi:hypothetical protein NPIL_313811 [Nephila pilipes]|uniref:Uncharacterized protein n=1 Tax=Nephila pilipes TaxID=299642 RepID=A0A8X6P971_NEPPI|nr:hypothetical protein NPIL_313811 [Nephila pilipes]
MGTLNSDIMIPNKRRVTRADVRCICCHYMNVEIMVPTQLAINMTPYSRGWQATTHRPNPDHHLFLFRPEG